MDDTRGMAYTHRLARTDPSRLLSRLVQLPYRWNLRRQRLGITLDVGCGVGRHLEALPAGSLGVDHNAHSVEAARQRGLPAVTTDEWEGISATRRSSFDGLLVAHVVEHLAPDEAEAVLRAYLPALRPGGKVFLVCPQERGYKSDSTHVSWTTGEHLEELARACGLVPQAWRSFPFPRWAGRLFTHNEFTVLAVKPQS